MRTIAVIARKGGSGKTTLAVHLALAAHHRGYKTLLGDADPQRSSWSVLKGRRSDGPACVETSGPKLFALQVAAQRSQVDLLVIDTAAGAEDELAHAIVLSDLCVMVIRPTFLDFAAAVRTVDVIRRKPGVIVLNQAPAPRSGTEPPAVKKAQEALRLLRLPVAPIIVRSRSAYQVAMECGTSVEELDDGGAAGQEIGALWSFIQRLALGKRTGEQELCA